MNIESIVKQSQCTNRASESTSQTCYNIYKKNPLVLLNET